MGLYVIGASTVIYFATGSRFVLSTPNVGSGPPAITCREDANASTALSLAQTSSPAAADGSQPKADDAQRETR